MQHYPLSLKPSVQTLYPYGVTVDRKGNIWFTEAGRNQLGRLEPATGAIQVFSLPDPQALTMEITSDEQGSLWVTSFTPGLLFRFKPISKVMV
jgi:virginiamycin B lyase